MNNSFYDLLNSQDYPNSQQYPNSQDYPNSQQYPNSQDYPNSQQYPNSLDNPNFENFYSTSQNNPNFQFTSSSSQNNPNIINLETSQEPTTTKQKKLRQRGDNNLWSEKEDEALMSAWSLCSTNAVLGKNQKEVTRWKDVLELYEQSRLENPNEINKRNQESLRCRYRKINEYANKWVSCYGSVIRQKKSGSNMNDEINEAQKRFEKDTGVRYASLDLFNNVLSKHPKWRIDKFNMQQININSNDEVEPRSSSSSKRSRVNESDDSNPEMTPSSVNASEEFLCRPEGRDAAKKKQKGKSGASGAFCSSDFREQLNAMQISREEGVKVMQRKLECELEMEKIRHDMEMKKREERREKIELRKREGDLQVYMALLGKSNLTPEEENLKRILMNKLWGN